MRTKTLFNQFKNNNRGLAAIEFALVGPFIVLALIGSVAAFDLFKANSAVVNATTTVVDLVSRQSFLNDDIRDTMFVTARALIGRYGTEDSHEVSITSIFNNGEELVVDWSEATTPEAALDDGDIASLDLPTIPDGETLIFVLIENEYEPVFSKAAFGRPLTFARDARRRPRFVARIAYEDDPSG